MSEKRKTRLSSMTVLEVKEALERTQTVILPVGTTEQHGPHCPVACDWLCPSIVAEKLVEKIDAIIAPPIMFGYAEGGRYIPGTIILKPNTFVTLLKEVGICLAGWGVKRIIAINGHGGNPFLINLAGREIVNETGIKFTNIDWWEIADEELQEISETRLGGHADEPETSLCYAAAPDWARPELAPVQYRESTKFSKPYKVRGNRAAWVRGYSKFEDRYNPKEGKYGIDGDARKASVEKGHKFAEVIADKIVEFLQETGELE